MKKDDIDIERLLERYYSAETTPDEEYLLQEYFASGETDPKYMADAKLFRSLASLHQMDMDTGVPEDLLGKLEDSLTKAAKLNVWRRRAVWTGIAAAVAGTIVWTGLNIVDKDSGMPDISTHNAVAVQAPDTQQKDTVREEVVAPSVISSNPSPRHISRTTEKAPTPRKEQIETDLPISQAEFEDDGYIEIEDPEAVLKLTERISSLMAFTSETSQETIIKANEPFCRYEQLTDNDKN